MGKGRKKRQVAVVDYVMPTPEVLAGDDIEAGYILHDETGLKAYTYRRTFKARHFDRLHRSGAWTEEQYLAGCWYRDAYERGCYGRPASSDLMKVHGSVSCMEVAFSTKQEARDKWRAARMALPKDMIGFVDGLILRDRWPKLYHRERARSLIKLAKALDDIARFLRFNRY